MPQRLTRQTLQVLEEFLAHPDERLYGLELIDATGLASGTIYPLLHRLTTAGWLATGVEGIHPEEAGRPERRLYWLTGEGASLAREAVESRRSQPRQRNRSRLGLAGT